MGLAIAPPSHIVVRRPIANGPGGSTRVIRSANVGIQGTRDLETSPDVQHLSWRQSRSLPTKALPVQRTRTEA